MKKIISLILKTIVIVFALWGTILSMLAGKNSFMGGSSVLKYFTIQSNIALAVLSMIGGYLIVANKKITNTWYVIQFVGAISITLTGSVFCFVLAPTMGKAAWNMANVFTHVIVPIAAVIDFFVSCINSDIKKKQVFFVTLPPLAYAIYAGVAFICNWEFSPGYNYPYFFLNWGSPAGAFGFCNELPFMGCMWWILLLLVLLILAGLLYLAILNGIKKQIKKKKQ